MRTGNFNKPKSGMTFISIIWFFVVVIIAIVALALVVVSIHRPGQVELKTNKETATIEKTAPSKKEDSKTVIKITQDEFTLYYFAYVLSYDSIKNYFNARGMQFAGPKELKTFILARNVRRELIKNLPENQLPVLALDFDVYLGSGNFINFKSLSFDGEKVTDGFFRTDDKSKTRHEVWFLAYKEKK